MKRIETPLLSFYKAARTSAHGLGDFSTGVKSNVYLDR